MNPLSRLAPFVIAIFLFEATPSYAADDYQPGRDSIVQTNVPQGEVLEFNFASSKIFPGTTRAVKVYVPKQYDPAKPACLFVNQDGVR
jgi:gluconolactonase